MNKNPIITINGKQYNAKTGEPLHKHTEAPKLTHQAQPAKPAPKPQKQSAVTRTPAKHVVAHTPSSSKTLMRQAVKRPSSSLKRRIHVQSNLGSIVQQPASQAHDRSWRAQHADQQRSHVAIRKPKSQLISHFSPSTSVTVAHVPVPVHQAATLVKTPSHASAHAKKPQTTAELLEYALQHATSHEQQAPAIHRRKLFKRQARSVVAR